MTTPAAIPRRTAAVAVAALGLAAACGGSEGVTAYVGATVFDGGDSSPIPNAVILVADGRVTALGPAETVGVPRGAQEIRLDGRWVIPGLIDAHVHTADWMLPRFVAYGVTAVRDLGGPQEEVFARRDRVNAGTVLGPRMYASGAAIDGAGGGEPHATVVRTAQDARRAVDQLVLAAAAQIKVYPRITLPLLRPLLDEALTLRTPVAAHLGKVDALTAAELGVSTLEHMTGVVEAAVANPRIFYDAHDDPQRGWNTVARGWATLDSTTLEGVARELVHTGIAIVPTLVRHETHSRLDDSLYASRLDLAGVPDSLRPAWLVSGIAERGGLTRRDFDAFRRSRPVQDLFVRLFARAGGTVAAGTDTPRPLLAPGASLHDEIALLVEAGLSPRDALLAATRHAARVIRADSVGVIREGAVADFVVLSGDPLADIANTRSIEMVVIGGSIYRPQEIARDW